MQVGIIDQLRKKKIGLRKVENIFYIHTTTFVMKWLAGFICLFIVFIPNVNPFSQVPKEAWQLHAVPNRITAGQMRI